MFFYTFMPKLLNMSLTAGVAIVFVILLRLLLKKAPTVISYALWGVVLFRLLCPVSIGSDFSVYNLFDAPAQESGTITSVIEYVPSNIVHTEYPSVALPVPGISDVINDALPQGQEQLVADPLEAPMSITTYIWMIGVLVMAIYSIVSYVRLRRKLSVVVPLRDNIFIADDIKSPFVVGLFRPKIYLPCNLGDKEQEYIILHEQHHIKRLDHVMKALAFLALAIHWFNPLVWVAFILASKDMEMSCDEAVIRKIGGDVRADYSASLLTLATGRRIIAGTPLAFGEGDTKGRINNLSKWKKPAVWVVLLAVVACVILAISLLTNPSAKREFPINGSNVSELDTERVIEMIAKAEKLEDGSQLCVNEDGFDLMFTSDFNWANDGAIRYFYVKDQQFYSAQLRMFHDDNKYFITDSSKWIEQEQIFKLFHYLDALKYMPQEEIRKLSPDADGYSVFMRHEGAPSDYERVLKYSQNGVNSNDGWYIHLEVQPLHEVEGGGYNGTGDEVIHLFYNSGDNRDDIAGKTYLYDGEGFGGSFTITLYEDGTFTYYEGMLSSYIGTGTFMLDGDTVIMTDNGHGGYGLVNRFRRDGDDLIFVEQDSDNFIYVKVKDGEKFHCTGEAFKLNDTTAVVTKWFDYLEIPDEMKWDDSIDINLPEFPDVTFRWSYGEVVAVKGNEITSLYTGMPIWSTYFCDLTGDGLPELCSTISWGSGMIDNRVMIYDYANGASYSLEDRGVSDYTLRQDESDGQLYVDKTAHVGGGLLSTGRLVLEDNCLQVLWPEKPNDDIREITDPTDDPNFAYDTAVEKIYEDEHNEYYISGLYSQYIIVHYTDGTQEDIVTALNAGRATFADLDKFGIRYWAEPKADPLEAAISAAILKHYRSNTPDGLIHVESHVMLANETMSGTPLFGADNHIEKVTAYLLVHHVKYSTYGGTLEAVGGSYVPTAITFRIGDSGEHILEEYWEPRDGSYYVKDVRDKFPGASADDALNDQAYIEELKAQTYNKALAYLNNNISLDVRIAELLDEIQASPAQSSNPGAYIREHQTEYEELLSYGEYTLRYCFAEFLHGGQIDLRGHIMALACQDIADALGEKEEPLENVVMTGQDWFDGFSSYAQVLAKNNSAEELEKHYPATFLLLQMSDSEYLTKGAPN